ncbi:MAG: MATE family efflux transporter [Bacteroidetes bacterium]|nr:MATE family efflux transporter [Bacteroidota bacterium]
MSERYEELSNEKISVLLRRYSIPSIVSMVVVALYNIVDRIYIGQGVGTMAISGLTLTFPISAIVSAIGTLVGVGAGTRISIVLGMKDMNWAKNILGHVPILTLIMSTIFIIPTYIFLEPILMLFGASEATLPYAVEYLNIIIPASVFTNICFSLSSVMRGGGFPEKSMITILIGVIINIILDPIFIFGFDMGIKGAGLATAISMFIGAVFAIVHFTNKKNDLSFCKGCFKMKWNIVKHIFSIGFSPFIMNFISCGIVIIINIQILKYGGDIAIGAFGIINSYQMLMSFIIVGLCQGMQPIIGYNYGANNLNRVKETFFLTSKIATIIFTIGFLFVEIFPEYATRLFTTDAKLIAFSIDGLRITSCVWFTIGIQIVIANYFLAINKVVISIILTTARQLIYLIPTLIFLPTILGLNGVWWAIPISDFLAFSTAIFFLLKEKNLRTKK